MLMRTGWPAVLRTHHLFLTLEPEQFERVAREVRLVRVPAGECFVQAGEPADAFFVVAEGSVKLSLFAANGDEKVLDIIAPGQSFAEALLFMQAPVFPVSATAIADSIVLRVPSVPFCAMLAENRAACFKMLAHLSARLHVQVREIEALTLENARQRLIRFLLARVGTDCKGTSIAHTGEPRNVLASHLSMQPETFSRLIKALTDEGMIRPDGRDFVIEDLARLQRA
ncbi:MAG: Crp/Fnr family transcriptional regulator [Steroidobacteraceae bacterium]